MQFVLLVTWECSQQPMELHAQLLYVPLIIVTYVFPWTASQHALSVNKAISLTHTSNVFLIVLLLTLFNVMFITVSIVMQQISVVLVLLDGMLLMACVKQISSAPMITAKHVQTQHIVLHVLILTVLLQVEPVSLPVTSLTAHPVKLQQHALYVTILSNFQLIIHLVCVQTHLSLLMVSVLAQLVQPSTMIHVSPVMSPIVRIVLQLTLVKFVLVI